MPYPNEHSQRINNPDKYIRIRRQNNKFGIGIHAIFGVTKDGKTEVQAIRFDKTKFSVSEAKAWLKDHDYKTTGFEAAIETKANEWIEGLILSDKAEPRKEIMLFPFGDFEHPMYGKLKFDNKFFSNIISNHKKNVLGVTPFIDKEHKAGEALGWLNESPYIRQGIGLFIKPDWTDMGKTLLKDKIYKYFSPWFEDFRDPEDGKVYKDVLRGGAATNIPFLKTMPPILDDTGKYDDALTSVSIMLTELKYTDSQTDSSLSGGQSTEEAGQEQKLGKGDSDNKYTILEDKMNEDLKKLFNLSEDIKEEDVIKEIEKQLEELKTNKEDYAKIKKELDELKENKDNNKDESKQMSEKLDKTEKQLTEVTKTLNEKERDIVISKALSEGKIVPADKEYWEKKFMENPKDIADVISHMSKTVDLSVKGVDDKGVSTMDSSDLKLMEAAKKMAEEKKIKLSEAIAIVAKENPEFAREYESKYFTDSRRKFKIF